MTNQEPERANQANARDPIESSAVILVVDDTEANRYTLSRRLQQAGFRVIEAETGEEALRLAHQKSPDLVLLDVKLPDINGYEVVRRLKADPMCARIPVIHTSAAFTRGEDHLRGVEGGGDAFLTSPTDPLILLSTIKAWLRVSKAEKERERGSQERQRVEMESKVAVELERKRLEKSQRELANERDKLNTIFRESPAAMAIWRGPEMVFEEVNPQYQALFPNRDLVGKPFLDALPEFRGQPFTDLFKKVLQTGEPFVGHEVLARHRRTVDGPVEDFYYDVIYVQIRDSEGKPYGVYNHSIDVTDRVRVRRALTESEERFRQIANTLPLIIWTATPDGLVDWYNDWWYKYLGMPRGTRWDDSEKQPMHPEDVARTWPIWQESLSTGKPFEIEQRFRRGSDGQYRWHMVRGEAIRDAAGKIVKWAGGNADIHDQKEITARLEQERDLREQFVATLSHDLRTPLTAARMSAQLLARRSDDPAMIQKISGRIAVNVDRADQMIRDLLDANRIRAGEKIPIEIELCDWNQIAADTIEELSTIHGDRFVLRSNSRIEGYCGQTGVRRIIENLCTNAVKYGAAHQPITVSLTQVSEGVEIEVHNEGPPISPQDQKNLFDPFRRTESALTGGQKGWGLGLTLVRGITEAHGGTVAVESSAEKGTTFRVSLPIDARSHASLASPIRY